MGLTIHYSVEAGKDWTARQIRQKLEDTRRFALTLPVVSVSDVAEFCGHDCHFDQDPDSRDEDPFRWAKIQAGRWVESPWRPGESRKQTPSHMFCLSIYPAEGSEEMNVGWCSFSRYVWEAEKDHPPGWSNVFCDRSYRASEKLLRAFLAKYRLVKIPESRGNRGRLRGHSELLHYSPGGGVSIRSGRYLSHRKGYGPSCVELHVDDCAQHQIRFRFRGTIDEARVLFAGRQFKADLEDIIHGKEYLIPDAHGIWSSFCKTQYANNPEVGGWDNFQRAHLSVLAVLEYMQENGFKVEVNDESDFWEDRDLAALARTMGVSDVSIAELAAIRQDNDSFAGHLERLRMLLVSHSALSV